jgi:hypothetical protein
MSIMDFFKPAENKPAATAATVAATIPEVKPAADGVDQNNLTKSASNPFDAYAKLFKTASENSEIQAPTFSLDPKVIADVAGKMDFTKGISPELIQKANSGDAAAMMQLIQETGRNSYRAALEHATKLTDTHLGQRSEFESKNLKRGVKEQMTSDALSQDNANLNHPVIKAELNRIAKQFAASPEYADASPAEIAKAAHTYLNDLHSAMNPADPSKTKEGKAKSKEIDYMAYITGQADS